jgi:molybdopterin synthase catalytic subunit
MMRNSLAEDDLIKVHEHDFDMASEYQRLRQINANNGAVVLFVGLVRDFNQNSQLNGLFLEHYPAMTQSALVNIVKQAKEKWPLGNITVIHRVGHLCINDQIVLVGVSSQHRHAAFAGAEFIMDYLKVSAPFWKKELSDAGDVWVEAKSSDNEAVKRW